MTGAHGRAIPQGGGSGNVQRLSERDERIVELVGRFRLMTGEQIGAVIFTTQASKTPLDRSLLRLTVRGYLARLARFVGGEGGGSGRYVYQLGRAGWRVLGKSGVYRPLRSVSLHTLLIAECFVALKNLERGGGVTLITFQPEPSCHQSVAGTLLTPDAFIEIGVPAQKRKYAFWLEVDRDTEKPETLKDKCIRYWRAYKAWESEVFPYVLFVVPDSARQREIERVIASGPVEAQGIFKVQPLEHFASIYPQEPGANREEYY